MRVEAECAHRRSVAEVRRSIGGRLRERRAEIEETILTRILAVADAIEPADYLRSLRATVPAAVAYGITAVAEQMDELRPAPLPAEVISQARRAARRGVPLERVLRRYLCGRAVLADFVILEFEAGGWPTRCLSEILKAEASAADHLIETIAAEYRLEFENGRRSAKRQRAELVRKLLAGDQRHLSELNYELSEWHLGAVTVGAGAEALAKSLAAKLDRRVLLVHQGEDEAWAWFGGRRPVTSEELQDLARVVPTGNCSLAIGEPGEGMGGWRLTHRQAAAAATVAGRYPGRVVMYKKIAMLASALQDELLSVSLRKLYVEPLKQERQGEMWMETLRAYFAVDRNVASAAAALGVSRRTVANRLRTIEERLRWELGAASRAIEMAIQLDTWFGSEEVASVISRQEKPPWKQ